MEKFVESAAKLADNVAALLKVKTIVTLSLTWVFCRLAHGGVIPTEFLTIYTMIVGFYFGTQQSKKE
jgi:hypothetical protein